MEQLRQQKDFVILKFMRVILHVQRPTIHVRAPRVDPNFCPSWFEPQAWPRIFDINMLCQNPNNCQNTY